DPGAFYIGDVGWYTYEELDVCYTAGMNFGWPLFEGMDASPSYPSLLTPDVNAPNPLYGSGQCLQPDLDFQDLITQETLSHPTGLPNPCDPSTLIPPNIHTFLHSRPVIDWQHGTGSRCSAFSGDSAVEYDLDDPNSPVPGPLFGGNASVGGTFLTGTGWPVGYQNCYFQADYGQTWIKRVTMTADNKAVQVNDFASNMGAVVFLKEGPDGALWYIRYETGQIRKISPIGITNLPPVAVAQQDTVYGVDPLTVDFTGSNSTDPENGPLSYLWNFGDGATSTTADTTHIFSAPAGVPTTYNVMLTVYDDHGQPNSTTLIVSVNNTPPHVQITSFPDGQLYPVGVDTTIDLEAQVTDAEQGPAGLAYSWRSILHHNNHVHAEPVDHAVESSAVLSGLGCYEETYFYEVQLTVTDAGGLSTTVSHFLYPNCATIAPTAVIVASSIFGPAPLALTLDGSSSVDNGSIVGYFWDFGDGTFSTAPTVSKTFTSTGEHQVELTVTDNDGLTSTATRVISVYTLDPPQCMGPSGSVL
ncbi:MAG: PKD domain-containing protein, partial [Flavobacteriales bacterium]